jgi:hypothetical protein
MTDEQVSQESNHFILTNLGGQLDGWADLVEGMGEKTEEVREAIMKELISKDMPEIQLAKKEGYVNEFTTNYRIYLTATKSPGITTLVSVKKHGTDLYISWRTFIRPVLNALLVLILLGASLANGWLAMNRVSGWFVNRTQVFISTSIVTWVVLTVLAGLLGYLLHQNPAHFFLVRVTLMTADDITALSLSVHKAILSAFDQVGIDTSKLRLKEKFSGGRKGEDI